MNLVSVFCMSGGHAVQFIFGGDDFLNVNGPMLDVPPGWALVEAEVIPAPRGPDDPWAPGIWFAKQGTGCKVLCCPDHPIIQP